MPQLALRLRLPHRRQLPLLLLLRFVETRLRRQMRTTWSLSCLSPLFLPLHDRQRPPPLPKDPRFKILSRLSAIPNLRLVRLFAHPSPTFDRSLLISKFDSNLLDRGLCCLCPHQHVPSLHVVEFLDPLPLGATLVLASSDPAQCEKRITKGTKKTIRDLHHRLSQLFPALSVSSQLLVVFRP